jgi:hypothetical protein
VGILRELFNKRVTGHGVLGDGFDPARGPAEPDEEAWNLPPEKHRREGQPERYMAEGQLRSPKGPGVTIDGKWYAPGEWIPGDVGEKVKAGEAKMFMGANVSGQLEKPENIAHYDPAKGVIEPFYTVPETSAITGAYSGGDQWKQWLKEMGSFGVPLADVPKVAPGEGQYTLPTLGKPSLATDPEGVAWELEHMAPTTGTPQSIEEEGQAIHPGWYQPKADELLEELGVVENKNIPDKPPEAAAQQMGLEGVLGDPLKVPDTFVHTIQVYADGNLTIFAAGDWIPAELADKIRQGTASVKFAHDPSIKLMYDSKTDSLVPESLLGTTSPEWEAEMNPPLGLPPLEHYDPAMGQKGIPGVGEDITPETYGGEKRWTKTDVHITKESLSAARKLMRSVRDDANGDRTTAKKTVAQRLYDKLIGSSGLREYSAYAKGVTAMHGDTPEEKTINGLIGSWASSSSDGNVTSMSLQRAAMEEFGLPSESYDRCIRRYADAGKQVNDVYAKHGPFLRKFVRTMYNLTQADLKAKGIKWLTLYRGVHYDESPAWISSSGSWEEVQFTHNPISSWSTDFGTSTSFANSGGSSHIMLAAHVPAERVLSNPGSGFGCLGEEEFTIFGGDGDAMGFESESEGSGFDPDEWSTKSYGPEQVTFEASNYTLEPKQHKNGKWYYPQYDSSDFLDEAPEGIDEEFDEKPPDLDYWYYDDDLTEKDSAYAGVYAKKPDTVTKWAFTDPDANDSDLYDKEPDYIDDESTMVNSNTGDEISADEYATMQSESEQGTFDEPDFEEEPEDE